MHLTAILSWLAVGMAVAACASSNDGVFDSPGGASDASTDQSSDGGSCDLNKCAAPPFAGMIKCCTSAKTCGYKAPDGGACYAADGGSGGSGGKGGTGGSGGF